MKKFLNTPVEIKDLGEGELQAVVATDGLDRHGEILDIQGLDYADFKKNPVVLWAHDYTQPPIGKALTLRKSAGKLIAKVKFAIEESPFAKQIHDLYKGGFLNAFSIGFIPEEMEENRYTKSSMIEFSAVPIPANPDALALAKAKGIDVDLVFAKPKAVDEQKEIGGENKINMPEENKEEPKAPEAPTEKPKAPTEEAKEEPKAEDKSLNLEAVSKLLDEKISSLKAELDKPVVKNINAGEGVVTPQAAKMGKEEKFKLWLQGMALRDMSEYKEIMQKAGMTTSNTSAVVPPADFVAEVARLEEQYGVARRFATVRRSDKESIQGIYGGDDVALFETLEAQAKRSTKLTYTPWTMTFRKWAAILPLTDELLDSSAIDIWDDATQRFARAFAQKEDELVFTDSTSGIVNNADAPIVLVNGTSMEDIDFDVLNRMVFSVPTESMRNGRFYINRTVLGAIQRVKDQNNNYIWKPGVDGAATGTIWGYPYSLVEVLPGISDDADSTIFAVFGDLKKALLVERTGMQAKIFDTGSVDDPDDTSSPYDQLNLMTQDMQALRVVKRMNARVMFGEAFALLRTATAS